MSCSKRHFAKLGRLTSEEVTVQLICQKCMEILRYGLELCSLSKGKLLSLDFTVNRVLKHFPEHPNIKACRDVFGIKLPSVQLIQRFDVFMTKLKRYHCVNFCKSLLGSYCVNLHYIMPLTVNVIALLPLLLCFLLFCQPFVINKDYY